MRRLRHPIRAIREPFGTAGLIIAMVALVAALGGSAVAANSALSGKQKKEVEKIAKSVSKPGPAGAIGPAGAAGAKGDSGATGGPGKEGAAGTNGLPGTPGAPGTPGTSVTNTPIFIGNPKCSELGGAEFKVGNGTPTFACNGENGTGGGGGGYPNFLPPEKTEVGTWSLTVGESLEQPGGSRAETENAWTAVSFNLPLETQPTSVRILKPGETDSTCHGSGEAPQADPGSLCVYMFAVLAAEGGPTGEAAAEKLEQNASVGFPFTDGFFVVAPQGPPHTLILGAWAVTAPEAP